QSSRPLFTSARTWGRSGVAWAAEIEEEAVRDENVVIIVRFQEETGPLKLEKPPSRRDLRPRSASAPRPIDVLPRAARALGKFGSPEAFGRDIWRAFSNPPSTSLRESLGPAHSPRPHSQYRHFRAHRLWKDDAHGAHSFLYGSDSQDSRGARQRR